MGKRKDGLFVSVGIYSISIHLHLQLEDVTEVRVLCIVAGYPISASL